MSDAFKDKDTFNADLSKWDVSSVENMESMFHTAKAFNQNIGNWNVAKVKNMKSMFDNAQAFNQNIENWNVASVTDMALMFWQAFVFNADISDWDVAKVETMERMFYNAAAFNQDVSDWSVSVSATTTDMFQNADAFNGDREITATIATTQSVFTDAEIDLKISVRADACGSSECNLLTTTNERAEKGLYCDVKISPTTNSACASSGFSENLLPCSSWPNFIDESKATVYQKRSPPPTWMETWSQEITRSSTRADGNLKPVLHSLAFPLRTVTSRSPWRQIALNGSVRRQAACRTLILFFCLRQLSLRCHVKHAETLRTLMR